MAAQSRGSVKVLPKGVLGMPLTQDSSAPPPPPELAPWLAGVQQSAQASRVQSAMSASGLEGTDPHAESPPSAGAQPPVIEVARGSDTVAAAGIAKGARDVELPASSKGRYGSAIGRAVHGVLQLVNLSAGASAARSSLKGLRQSKCEPPGARFASRARVSRHRRRPLLTDGRMSRRTNWSRP